MRKKLPTLKTERALHRFWSSHSPLDYPGDFKEIDERIILAPELAHQIRERIKKKMISLRLEKWQLRKTKEIASKKHMPYQHLLRHWISLGLKQNALGG